jgi:hypothetical protein
MALVPHRRCLAWRSTNDMIESISKPKLPKGLAYSLKTSQLVRALDDAGVDIHIDLVYWRPQVLGSILEAHYWLPNKNVPYPRVYVRAGCVPAVQRAAASESLSEAAIPQFIDWLTGILNSPANSTRLCGEPYFNATYINDRLSISYTPQYKRRRG